MSNTSNYITASDVELRIGTTKLANFCGSSQAAIVAAVIARAESVIDGFASALYETPLQATPLIREWALCIAEYELYKRGAGSQVPQKILDSYRMTISQLSDLAARRMGTGGQLVFKTNNLSSAPVAVLPGRPSVFRPEDL